MPAPYRKEELSLKAIEGRRVGVDGTWFAAVLRSHLKAEDPFYALNGPVSPAFIRIIEKFVKRLSEFSITPVFVFEGLYPRRQGHPAHMMHTLDESRDDLPVHVRDTEPLAEDALHFLPRVLIGMNLEVQTAPYLSSAQLAYLAVRRDGQSHGGLVIDEVMGTHDVLCYGTVSRVFIEIGRVLDDPSAMFTVCHANGSAEDLMRYTCEPQRIVKSLVWSWAMDPDARSDLFWVKSTMDNCPVFTVDGEVKPFSKAVHNGPSVGDLSTYYYHDLGSDFPLVYFLLSANVLSPQLLSVVATERFLDDPPLVKSTQYNHTLERIIPLRTQIVFQLVQELQRYLHALERTITLQWDRPYIQAQLPIQRPPKIILDEWEGINPRPEAPYNFVSVLEYSNNAKAPPEDETGEPMCKYDTAEQALGAVLLKSLDLLGYFTHAAHSGAEAEESSMSIFAMALNAAPLFGNEAVLLIELTRTRSLHDESLDVYVHPRLKPSDGIPTGARYAARVMSLLPLVTEAEFNPKLSSFSVDLLAFNEVARAFQRNLRMLTEAIAVTQLLNGTAKYPLRELRDFAYRLPFVTPLTTHAGTILEYMMLFPDYKQLPAMGAARSEHLAAKFPHVKDMKASLQQMARYWESAVTVVIKLLEDEEADEDFKREGRATLVGANALVVEAFRGITQLKHISAQ